MHKLTFLKNGNYVFMPDIEAFILAAAEVHQAFELLLYHMRLIPYQGVSFQLQICKPQYLDQVRKFQWHIQHGDSLKTEIWIVVAMIISARYSSEHLSLYNSSSLYGRFQSLHIWTFHCLQHVEPISSVFLMQLINREQIDLYAILLSWLK